MHFINAFYLTTVGVRYKQMHESRRITGTEMEWGGMIPGDPKSPELHQVEDKYLKPRIEQFLKKSAIRYAGESSYFLSNGARFYPDTGNLREYATPEDDSYIGTVANEIAGDLIMTGVGDIYTEETKNRISFSKRVIDDELKSCGYHINYSADAKRMDISPGYLALYAVFAATRPVLFGAGALLPSGDFSIAQKVLSLKRDFDKGTTGSFKAVVNLRDEPLADKTKFLRFHDTSSDPNMSPWASRVKVGAGSLVLRLIENDYTIEQLRLQDPLHVVAKRIAMDTSLTKRFRLENGSYVTALEVQQRIASTVRLLSRRLNFSAEDMWTLDEWERAIRDLKDDPRKTIDRVEWAMRYEVLKRQSKNHGWGWNSEDLRYKDRQFSDIGIDGIALALRKTVWAKYMPDKDLIKDRVKHPPASTRAHVRGRFIQHMSERGVAPKDISANWDRVSAGDKVHVLKDPFSPRHSTIEDLLAS